MCNIILKKDLCDFELSDYIKLLKINNYGDRSEIIEYFNYVYPDYYESYINDLETSLNTFHIKSFSELLNQDRYCNIIRDYFDLDNIKKYITGVLEFSDYKNLLIDPEYIAEIINNDTLLSDYITDVFITGFDLRGIEKLYNTITDFFCCPEILDSIRKCLNFKEYSYTDSEIAQHLTGYLMTI